LALLIFFAFASQSPVDFQVEWTRFPLNFERFEVLLAVGSSLIQLINVSPKNTK
jgi:hypothetical protein